MQRPRDKRKGKGQGGITRTLGILEHSHKWGHIAKRSGRCRQGLDRESLRDRARESALHPEAYGELLKDFKQRIA